MEIVDLYSLHVVKDLPPKEQETLIELVELWDAKLSRNQLKVQYYEGLSQSLCKL